MTYKETLDKYIKSSQSRRTSRAKTISDMLMTTSNPVGSSGSVEGSAPYNPADTSTGLGNKGGGSSFQKFINSIAKQESGGNYRAVNKSSGALGKYQIMPSNVPSWSKEALGHSITPQQFLKSPNLQERVARSKLSYYFNKYGAAGAAKAWYGGEGAARRSSNTRQGAYPSINAYASRVTSRLR